MVRALSSVTVRLTVMLIVLKSAMRLAPLAIKPLLQLLLRAPSAVGVVGPHAAGVGRIQRAVVKHRDLGGGHGVIGDFHFIEFSIEQRVGENWLLPR